MLKVLKEVILKKGDVFWHRQYSYKGVRWYKTVIVEIIQDDVYDDVNEVMYVFRWFGEAKPWWHYKLEEQFRLSAAFERGEYVFEEPEKYVVHVPED